MEKTNVESVNKKCNMKWGGGGAGESLGLLLNCRYEVGEEVKGYELLLQTVHQRTEEKDATPVQVPVQMPTRPTADGETSQAAALQVPTAHAYQDRCSEGSTPPSLRLTQGRPHAAAAQG